MAEYQLTATDVVRRADGASIPNDPLNNDRIAYQEWLAAGNVPDPAPVEDAFATQATSKPITELVNPPPPPIAPFKQG